MLKQAYAPFLFCAEIHIYRLKEINSVTIHKIVQVD